VTKIQRVDRPTNQSFYVVMPSALAQAFELDKGEEFEWIIEDKNLLLLRRVVVKKKIRAKKLKD
jgi:antitoxin component of MazEF toxin-antitoxin module